MRDNSNPVAEPPPAVENNVHGAPPLPVEVPDNGPPRINNGASVASSPVSNDGSVLFNYLKHV